MPAALAERATRCYRPRGGLRVLETTGGVDLAMVGRACGPAPWLIGYNSPRADAGPLLK